jgi:tripartite-type tricarboxylate transporter receptor subunit TctC
MTRAVTSGLAGGALQSQLGRRSFLLLSGALALSTAACSDGGAGSAAAEEDFPTRAIELVNPFPAGGSHDAHARAIGSIGKDAFGQPIQVAIRSGGGGTIGASYVAKQAKPDGYTIMLGDPGSVIIQPLTQKVSYTTADLAPIAQIDESPIVLVTLPDSPWNTLQDLIDAAKAKPGTITYGAGPKYGNDQLGVELLTDAAGIELKHVPIDGGGNVYRATLAGDVQLGAVFPASATKDLAEGRLKALGVTSQERIPGLDKVPTCKEQGVDVEWLMFRTVFVPAKTPQSRQDALAKSFEKLGSDPKFVALLTALGETPAILTGDALRTKIKQVNDRLAALIKSS